MKFSNKRIEYISNYKEETLDFSQKDVGFDGNIDLLCDALKNNVHVKCLILSHNSLTSNCIPTITIFDTH